MIRFQKTAHVSLVVVFFLSSPLSASAAATSVLPRTSPVSPALPDLRFFPDGAGLAERALLSTPLPAAAARAGERDARSRALSLRSSNHACPAI